MIFRLRAACLLSGLAALLAGGAIASASASAVEAPYWRAEGKRLTEGEKLLAKLIGAPEKEGKANETIILSKLLVEEKEANEAEVEIRCRTMPSENANLIGSKPGSDGLFSITLSPRECKLWAKNGKEFVEESGCKVETIPGEILNGRFWLEGSTIEGKTKIVMLLEGEDIATFKITGAGCKFTGEDVLSGSLAAHVSPENAEGNVVEFRFPSPALLVVHQAQPKVEERKLELILHRKSTKKGPKALLSNESKLELLSHGKFGAFTI